MTKLKHLLVPFFLLTQLCCLSQGYTVRYREFETDSLLNASSLRLSDSFPSRIQASAYLAGLTGLLQARGYITASVDSLALDSAGASVYLYLGEQYRWARLSPPGNHQALLEALRWNDRLFSGPVNFTTLQAFQQRVLDHLEENGHPFGRVYLDSIEVRGGEVKARLQIEQGPLYKIDSIRVYGEARMNSIFLQRYLNIPHGSYYNRKKLSGVSRRLMELNYVQEEQPSNLSMLGTGSVLNLYLKPRKSSQVNALIGFLPNNSRLNGDQKLLLTVDANLLLRNAFGGGETIGLVWQQLQQSSPRLNLLYDQPYIFGSAFGLNFSLDMYRRDSVFLNLNINLGTSYRISERKTGSVFLQRRQTIVNAFNTAQIIQSRQLPPEIDVSSMNLGVSYQFNSTDYRFNPRRGTEFSLTASAGTKSIRRNNQILELKDPSDPSFNFGRLYDTLKRNGYQVRFQGTAARYFQLGGQSTVKAAVNAGIFQSASYFRNEFFQIGGYRLLRGFDEESQFVSRYAVGTLEYRYLLGLNSAFFVFVDGGYGNHRLELDPHHTYISTGLGLSFETKAGIFNLAWAVGTRNDQELQLRRSKVHVGYVSYF